MSGVQCGASRGVTAVLVMGFSSMMIAGAPPSFAQDKASIQKRMDKYAEAYNKGDVAAVVAIYADDAVVLPPDADMVKGKNNLQPLFKQMVDQTNGLKLITIDVQPLGNDAAREIGNYSISTKGANPQQMSGKYVIVWQKFGNDWKIGTDTWNSNAPPAATGSTVPPTGATQPRRQ